MIHCTCFIKVLVQSNAAKIVNKNIIDEQSMAIYWGILILSGYSAYIFYTSKWSKTIQWYGLINTQGNKLSFMCV